MIISCSVLLILVLNITLNYYTTEEHLMQDNQKTIKLTTEQLKLNLSSTKTPTKTNSIVSELFVKTKCVNELINKMKQIYPFFIEIVGIDYNNFLKTSSKKKQSLKRYNEQNNHSIIFGSQQYAIAEADHTILVKAINKREDQFYVTTIKGKKVLRSFIPVFIDTYPTFIISVVVDYSQISARISEQLIRDCVISSIILEIVIFLSYFLAGFVTMPIHMILSRVNDVAQGRFDFRLNVRRKDELGQLANRINAMIRNLAHYTNRLKQMYVENREVKEHLESVINQTADAIHITDLEGNVLRVNRAFEDLYGWKSEELVGKCLTLIPQHLEQETENEHQQLLERLSITCNEKKHLKKDGSFVEVSVSTAPVKDRDGNITAFISVARDITNRNRMEEILRRSEKLTTVGQLAAGVAHEIRNPLTTLGGFLQLQQATRVLNIDHVKLMLSELDRINLIIGEFLILAKPQAVHFQKKDIRVILEDVTTLLASQAHLHGTQFLLYLSSNPANVYCESNQLKQVFINLLKNGMEAMPTGGKIKIQLLLLQDQVRIDVIDEGIGISEQVLPKLGEPFFTSKKAGTGLGLMVSQRIIQSHRGTIEIKSDVGKGTTVSIYLPRSQPPKES